MQNVFEKYNKTFYIINNKIITFRKNNLCVISTGNETF